MFPYADIEYEVHLQRHREEFAAARGQRPVARTPRQRHQVLSPALAWIGALACDSREGLVSQEQQLARWGVTWTTDPADDVRLAQELATSRRRRYAGSSAVPPAQPAVAPLIRAGLRRTVGAMLIRIGQRLQGRAPAATTP